MRMCVPIKFLSLVALFARLMQKVFDSSALTKDHSNSKMSGFKDFQTKLNGVWSPIKSRCLSNDPDVAKGLKTAATAEKPSEFIKDAPAVSTAIPVVNQVLTSVRACNHNLSNFHR